jgi:hypothetical protein
VRPSSARSAAEVLGDVLDQLENVFGALDTLAQRLDELAAGGRTLYRDDLASLRPTIFDVLAAHRDLVTGTGVIAAPNLLRDAPRWLEWWWTGSAGTPEPLRVNLDPGAPDFYDYTTADWYVTPERTGTRRMAGPYVDFLCTNEYTLTLSTPVRHEGRLLGMAAADVLVSSLERRVLPVLTSIGHPVVLAGADGRVIASNSPHWAPGLRVATDAAAEHKPWQLITVDDPAG